MNTSRTLAAISALISAVACSDSKNPTEQQPGSAVSAAVVSLSTPHSDDGAIVLTLRGPDVAEVQPASGSYITYTRATSGRETRLILVGDIAAGHLLTVKLGSAHRLSEYSGTVEQVASRSDILRTSTSEYKLTIAAPQ